MPCPHRTAEISSCETAPHRRLLRNRKAGYRIRAAPPAPPHPEQPQSHRAIARPRCSVSPAPPSLTASRWRRLPSTRSGTTLPGASSRAAQASRLRPSIAEPAHQHAVRRNFARQLGFCRIVSRTHFSRSLASQETPSTIQTLCRTKCNSWKGTQ